MVVTHWLRALCAPRSAKRSNRSSFSKRTQPNARWSAPSPALAVVEPLEDRTLLAVGSIFIQATGTLVVLSDAADNIDVTAVAGNVLVNGTDPQTGPLAASQVQAISVTGGQGGNDIDLTGVTAADFTQLSGTDITVFGGDGNDTMTASDLGGVYLGGHGNDMLVGGVGDETMDGDDGHDTLVGNDGADSLIGEDGNDSIDAGDGDDFVDGGDGTDLLNGDAGSDTIEGGDDSDTINGGTGDDLLNGGFSNDTLLGGDDNDTLFGGANDDLLMGGAGDDRLTSNAGRDTLDGGDGNDTLNGNVGDNQLDGGAGNDELAGGPGDDTLSGNDGDDTLDGAEGNDLLVGGDGSDSLLGGTGADSLAGEAGDDTLLGQAGNDTLTGGDGADLMDGGAGNDVVQSEIPRMSVDDVSVLEGDAGTTDAVFTVSLSQAAATPVTVDFATINGTATAGSDYVAQSGTLTIPVGQSSGTIAVAVRGDTAAETDETFFVDLSNVSGAILVDIQGQGTIVNDDQGIFIDDVVVNPEGDPQPPFGSVDQYQVTFAPVANAAGDFDSDGDIDVAAFTLFADAITISLNNGDGSFTPGIDFPTIAVIGIDHSSIAAGDIDGDGDVDLVVVGNLTLGGEIGIHLNDGTGVFSAPITLASGVASNRTVSLADTDNDGDLDVVVGGIGFSVLTNDGTGTLGVPTLFNVPAGRLSTVDINGDGAIDVVSSSTTQINISLNNGMGGFGPPIVLQGEPSVTDLVVDDFNGDGEKDIATVSRIINDLLSVHLNNGDGTFAARVTFPIADFPYALAAEDFDTDGDIDIAIGSTGMGAVTIMLNDGTGTGFDRTDISVPDGGEVAIVDLNNDGTLDLAVHNRNGSELFILLGMPQSRETADFTVSLALPEVSTVTVDFTTSDGSATAGQDYIAANGTVTFMPGVMTQSVTVEVIGDDIQEPDENFFVNLSNAMGAQIADGQGEGTIVDDDGLVGGTLLAVAPFFSNTELSTLDVSSGTATPIGPLGVNRMLGLTNDAAGSIYAIDDSGNALYTLNPQSGAATQLFALNGVFTGEGGIAFDGVNNEIVVVTLDPDMFRVDVTTGAVTTVGRLSFAGTPFAGRVDFDGVAFRGSTLYAIITTNGGPQLDDMLVTIDTTTRDVTVVGALGVDFGGGAGLAYDPDLDVFYATAFGVGLYLIDPTSGAATLIGPTGLTDPTGLTFVPGSVNLTQPVSAIPTLFGPNDDTLLGGDGNDTLLAGQFDDSLNGGAGDDLLDGGGGDDLIEGAAGKDTLNGGAGNDLLDGGRNSDTIEGDAGNDTVVWETGDGFDQVDGGLGFDELDVETGQHNDRITVEAATDGWFRVLHRIPSDASDVVITAGMTEILSLSTNGGADRIEIDDLTGVNNLQLIFLDAGRGSDLVDAFGQLNPSIDISILGGAGNDTVIGGAGDDIIQGQMGNDVLTGGDGADTIDGGAGVDKLFGGDGNDLLLGGDGRDFLYGEDGNDSLDGGNQNDDLFGGIGDDVLAGSAGDDSLLGENGDDSLSGGDGADTLRGGKGDDSLLGDAGVDSLAGDDGHDTLLGGADGDTLVGGVGNDLMFGGVGSVVLLDDGNDFLNGNAGNDTLDGERGRDSLFGGSGRDQLSGGFGDDQLNGNGGADSIEGGDGNDLLRGAAGNDTLDGGHGEDRLFGQAGDDGLSGHDGHDRLNGGGGNDTLHGGDGDDTLRGGAGVDLLIGHDGNDNLNGQGGNPDTLVGGDSFDVLNDNGGLDVVDNDFAFFAEWIDGA